MPPLLRGFPGIVCWFSLIPVPPREKNCSNVEERHRDERAGGHPRHRRRRHRQPARRAEMVLQRGHRQAQLRPRPVPRVELRDRLRRVDDERPAIPGHVEGVVQQPGCPAAGTPQRHPERRPARSPALLRLVLRSFRAQARPARQRGGPAHRRRAAGRGAERGHVHRGARRARLRPRPQHHGRAAHDHGAGVPVAARAPRQHLQLAVGARRAERRVDHLRHLPHRQHVGVAHPVRPAGPVERRAARPVLLHRGVAPLARLPRARRRGRGPAGQVPRQRRRLGPRRAAGDGGDPHGAAARGRGRAEHVVHVLLPDARQPPPLLHHPRRRLLFPVVCVYPRLSPQGGLISDRRVTRSGNGLISYYLSLILNSIGYTSQDTQTLINALITLWGLFWGLLASVLVNRFRRRTMFLASTLGSLVCYVVWTALQATYERQTDLTGAGSPGLAKGVLAMIFLYNVTFTMGWGALQVTYVVEILPFNLRARGLVLYNLFVALALIFNQYANPVGVTNSKWKYYITYDVWLAFEAVVVYFLFVETGKMSLEETAVILDGNADRLTEEVARRTEKLAVETRETAVQDEAKM